MKSILFSCVLVATTTHGMLDSSEHPANTFQPDRTHETFAPPQFIRNRNRPIPTNAWWGNLIHRDPKFPSDDIHPVFSNPYVVKIRQQHSDAIKGVHVGYSADNRAYGPPTGNGNGLRYYLHPVLSDFIFSSTEFQSSQTNLDFNVDNWDAFGVDITLSNGRATLESTLVNGMAFVTATYSNSRPLLKTVHAVLKVNGAGVKSTYRLAPESKLVVELNSGQYWGIYADTAMTLRYHDGAFTSESKLSHGTIRLARLHPSSIHGLDPYAGCIVKGAELKLVNAKRYGWSWKTQGSCSRGLLHFGLQHHLESIDMSFVTHLPQLTLASATRGKMYAFVSKSLEWYFNEPKTVEQRFYPTHSVAKSDVSKYRIRQHLEDEIKADWTVARNGSYYFNGKKMQLYGSLCLMANDAHVSGEKKEEYLKTCLSKFEQVWSVFLDQQWEHPLVYDEVYRGIISSQAFHDGDYWSDFGNTMYNDHHYHYGYWITSAAILKYLNPRYHRMDELNRMVELLIRDVANPSATDPHFPQFRHFNWYLGHSYSHGISPFADGKDQESTSEDVNLDYGLLLWGDVSKNHGLVEMGELMMKINTRAVQLYFLLKDDNPVHPAAIVENKVTGIFFDNKVEYATWFSPEKYCIHGIQMLPFSPVTPLLRTKEFVEQEWDQILSKETIIKDKSQRNPWQSILYSNYAIVNRNEALEHLQYVPMDDGLTRAWALYMAASQNN